MSWTVIIPDDVEAQIDSIEEEKIREKILDKLEDIQENPYPHIQKIRKYPFYKFRVEGYGGIISLKQKKTCSACT